MRVELLTEELLPAVSTMVAGCQRDPDRHVGYLSSDPAAIATDLRGLEPDGLSGTLVALTSDGEVAGMLGAEHDEDEPGQTGR